MKHRSKNTDAEVRDMLNATTVCLNCGIELATLRPLTRRQNIGYCSERCHNQLPPKMAYLCRVHGKEPVDLLLDLLNRHQNATIVAELCGAARRTLYDWMRKYGIERESRYFLRPGRHNRIRRAV